MASSVTHWNGHSAILVNRPTRRASRVDVSFFGQRAKAEKLERGEGLETDVKVTRPSRR